MEWADGDLAALVRWMLPARRSADWRVQVVDNRDKVCAMFSLNLVRVQRHWREIVFDAALHSVPGRGAAAIHHPLSLMKLRRGARLGLEIWKARAIRRDEDGLDEVTGYVARAVGGRQAAFDQNCEKVGPLALSLEQAPSSRPVSTARLRRRLGALEHLVARSCCYGDLRVKATDYEKWFPKASVAVFSHFAGEGVPLAVIVQEARCGLPELSEYGFEDFMVRLRRDLGRTEPPARSSQPLAPDDDAALSGLGLLSE
ncbi:hypothetical protein ABIF79_009946 [Bradyrhizobium japonicum]